jgi:hypothetical protein
MNALKEVSAQTFEPTKAQQSASGVYLIWILLMSASASVWVTAAFGRNNLTSSKTALSSAVVFLLAIGWCTWWSLDRDSTLDDKQRSKILSLAFSSFLLLVVFLPEYVLGKAPSLIKSAVLVALALCLFAAYVRIGLNLILKAQKTGDSYWKPKYTLFTFCVLYFLATTWYALTKLNALGYVGQDIAYFTQCLYTALHGHLLYSNMYHDLLYRESVSSDFAGHNQPILFLFLPFYALHKSASTLLIVRNVFMVLCAWPVYLISRRFLPSWPSVLSTTAFLMMPAILYQNMYDFAPLSIVGVPLLFAIYYFLKGRFGPFFLMLVLTQFVREDLVFVVFGMGLLGLWARRSAKWIAGPCALAVAWAALSWRIIFPHFLHGTTSVVAGCFTYLGTGRNALHNAATNLNGIFSHSNLVYLKQLVDSFGGILFPHLMWPSISWARAADVIPQ